MGDAFGWFMQVLKRAFVFEGRATRSEYWFFVLIYTVLMVVGSIITGIVISITEMAILGIVVPLVSLAMVIPMIACGIRRLHDIGKPGIYFLVTFIPGIGGLVLLYFMVQPSDGDNEFGPIPAYAPVK